MTLRDAGGDADARILEATSRAGKTYRFADDRARDRLANWWFQQSHEGLVLFAVFYTQACRWSLCSGCNLPSVCSVQHVGWESLVRQVDHLFSIPEVLERRHEVKKLIVSNNGSVLDEVTFSSTALMYLVTQVNLRLTALESIALETRVEYVDVPELEFLWRAIQERHVPSWLELAIGFEAFDDEIRNQRFLKGLTLGAFEEVVRKVARSHFRLKCYFMQKPVVGMTDEEAVRDVERGIDYLAGLSEQHGVPINLHLNPTYVARGTPLDEGFRNGTYRPPLLRDVARAVLHSEGKAISVYVGLDDEGLAVEGGSFVRPEEDAVFRALDAFNRTQDHAALRLALASAT